MTRKKRVLLDLCFIIPGILIIASMFSTFFVPSKSWWGIMTMLVIPIILFYIGFKIYDVIEYNIDDYTWCDKIRHKWDVCKCRHCGKGRKVEDKRHDWDVCYCRKCGVRRDKHDWNNCICRYCGYERHHWSLTPNENSESWITDDGHEEHIVNLHFRCERCRRRRSSEYVFKGIPGVFDLPKKDMIGHYN